MASYRRRYYIIILFSRRIEVNSIVYFPREKNRKKNNKLPFIFFSVYIKKINNKKILRDYGISIIIKTVITNFNSIFSQQFSRLFDSQIFFSKILKRHNIILLSLRTYNFLRYSCGYMYETASLY